jgi:predicted  nucleic acid-binding Zn-ribbon protein
MEASDKDIENLQRLQEIDVAAANDRRTLEGLPQRAKLAEIQGKEEAIRQKQAQVDKLADTNRTELSRVGAEIEILSIRQDETQKKIDESGSDYRAVDSLTKDMGSMADRTRELEANRQTIQEREQQISQVKDQIERALDALAAQEKAISGELAGQEATLQERLDTAEAERTKIISALPDAVADAYETARKHCGGVALSVLLDGKCTTCRSTLEESRLLQVRHQAPLATCPMCHRLLIVR